MSYITLDLQFGLAYMATGDIKLSHKRIVMALSRTVLSYVSHEEQEN